MLQNRIYALVSNPTVYRDLDSILHSFDSTKTGILSFCQGLWNIVAVIALAFAAINLAFDFGEGKGWRLLKSVGIGLFVSGIVVFGAETIADFIKSVVR